eukprot:CAMPEP_0181337304 /NCGR_PEP_ID=MMETSP1101-20121128/27936_1 /TAXON_ID=46948 /ORGANISM="Rhodomonas abbreviata, Strain Caron Lab Isolate" /LENGTH=148 /DNA_ID=CAMNT_0023447767 /DNA_START=127 /DNA_END=570 /DNA_ORIENTATION=+
MSAPSWLKSFAKTKKAKPAAAQEVDEKKTQASDSAPAQDGEAHKGSLDDYMNITPDEYVKSFVPVETGLPQKRSAASSGSAPGPTKSLKTKMSEALDEGLSNPLAEDNVGFRMLAKMGFKAGQGLGKNEAGTTEPVDVRIRGGRKGLG